MARWECIKLYFYHDEDPGKSLGFFSFLNAAGYYERREIKDLAKTLAQLESEGWKIDKVSLPTALINLESPVPGQRQETFQLTRRLE